MGLGAGTGSGRPTKFSKAVLQKQQRLARIAMLIQARPQITYREIADLLNTTSPKKISTKTIERDVTLLRDQWRTTALEKTEQVMLDDLSRLDAMIEAVWPQALGGDKYAIDRVANLISMKADILGYKRPEQVKVEVTSAPITIVEVIRAVPMSGPPVVEQHRLALPESTGGMASGMVTIDGTVVDRG